MRRSKKGTFSSVFNEMERAWNYVLQNWLVVLCLTLVALVSVAFSVPYRAEIQRAVSTGGHMPSLIDGDVTAILFVIGLIIFVVLSVLIRTGMYIIFVRQDKMSFADVVKESLRRFVPVFYTDLLRAFLLAVVLYPVLYGANWYYESAMSGAFGSGMFPLFVDFSMLIILSLFLIPTILVFVWFKFASLATAVRDSRGGLEALKYSMQRVQSNTLPLFGRIVVWGVLYIAILGVAQYIPFLSWFVNFVLFVALTPAFFVVLYKELGGEKV